MLAETPTFPKLPCARKYSKPKLLKSVFYKDESDKSNNKNNHFQSQRGLMLDQNYKRINRYKQI